MVIAQEPTQSLAALHRPLAVDVGSAREQQDVVLPLMIALSDGPVIRAAPLDELRQEFYRSYPADGDTEDKGQEAKRKAFKRQFEDAQQRSLVVHREVDGTCLVWLVRADRRDDHRSGGEE
jgi:hypothetical protein